MLSHGVKGCGWFTSEMLWLFGIMSESAERKKEYKKSRKFFKTKKFNPTASNPLSIKETTKKMDLATKTFFLYSPQGFHCHILYHWGIIDHIRLNGTCYGRFPFQFLFPICANVYKVLKFIKFFSLHPFLLLFQTDPQEWMEIQSWHAIGIFMKLPLFRWIIYSNLMGIFKVITTEPP